jgi:hypothetical protein
MDIKSADGRMKALVRFTSVLVMRFNKGSGQRSAVSGQRAAKLSCIFQYIAIMVIMAVGNNCYAEMVERVVAIVNDDVILHTELMEVLRKSKASGDSSSEKEILEKMIERKLVLQQVKRFRLDNATYGEDEREAQKLINGYVESRIKALIHVSFKEIENYYEAKQDDFGGKDLYESWDEIENILRNQKLTARRHEHIALLRNKAYIRIQLDAEQDR